MKRLLCVSFSLIAACGDDTQPNGLAPDAPMSPDASTFVPPAAVKVPISTTGNDRLLGVAAVPGGGFYAVGVSTPSFEPTSDRELVLVKLTPTGALDTSFGGGDGIVTLNAQTGGDGEQWRGIVVQPSGKIVVSGVVEDENVSTDRDVVIARFTAAGELDASFEGAGVTRLDLSNAEGTMGTDSTWGIATDPAGNLYVHAGQRADGMDGSGNPLTDTDFVVMRLTVDGAVDATFGTAGKFVLDIQRSSASVRGVTVLGDGKVLAYGYASSVSTGNTVQPVVYRLTPGGALDPTFATGGLFHEVVLTAQTEVYDLVVHPDGKLVTAGYGRNDPAGKNDWVSLRFTSNGALDPTWASGGKYVLDVTGTNVADNCRHSIALPNGRTALVGSGGPTNATSDAYIVILDDTGKPDPAFGNGILKYNLGGNDAFFGGARSADRKRLLVAGFKGGGETPSATANDDSHVVSLELD